MQIGNLIVGVIVVAFAALLLADGVLSYIDPSSQFLSLGSVEGLVGFSLLVLAASYFQKAKE